MQRRAFAAATGMWVLAPLAPRSLARAAPLELVQTIQLAVSGRIGDTDDVFVDAEAGRIYALCGDGFVDVIRSAGGDRYEHEARVPTRTGARTGLFSPAQHRLYVAVPRRIGVGAEIRVFAT